MSKKKVLIIGGIHGVGKSTVCAELARGDNALVLRQRHVLVEIGREIGLSWEDIGPLHAKFIDRVAETISCRIADHPGELATIDCHFAIRTAKALRVKNLDIQEPYIPDLDSLVVQRLAEDHEVRMMLLKVSPAVCAARLKVRNPHNTEFDNLLDGLRLKEVPEVMFFERLLARFGPAIAGSLILRNESSLEELYSRVRTFLE